MFYSSGLLKYSIYATNSYRLILEIDPEIARFYYSLIPKHYLVNKPKYIPHISVVRNEVIPNLQHWNKYENQSIEFKYNSFIFNNDIYFWLGVESNSSLKEIRKELGLSEISSITKSPESEHDFHITIANTKTYGRKLRIRNF